MELNEGIFPDPDWKARKVERPDPVDFAANREKMGVLTSEQLWLGNSRETSATIVSRDQ